MQMKQIRIIVVSISLIGISVLYAYSLTLEPQRIGTSELSEHEGEDVYLEGYVIDMSPGRDITFLTLRDDHGTASILVEGGMNQDSNVEVGDLIRILGNVYESENGYGVIVSGSSSIYIIRAWSGTVTTIPVLSVDPLNYLDRNVNVSCLIRYPVSDSEGYGYGIVADRDNENVSIPVYVYDIDVHRGYLGLDVYVNARFEYRRSSLRYVLVIDSPEHHIWAAEPEVIMNNDGE